MCVPIKPYKSNNILVHMDTIVKGSKFLRVLIHCHLLLLLFIELLLLLAAGAIERL